MAVVAGLALAGGACATSKMPVAIVPPAAQQAIDQYAEGGTICEMEMAREHGMVFYEAKVKTPDGARLTIVVNAAGKLYKLDRKDCKPDGSECKPDASACKGNRRGSKDMIATEWVRWP